NILGNSVYGWDTCQLVCHYNKGVDFHHHPEFAPEPDVAKPKLIPMLNASNREFRNQSVLLAVFWRGRNPLQGHAIIGPAHYKDKTAIDDLIEVLNTDVRPAIRGTAAWSLGKIGTEKSYIAIEKALEKEQHEQARAEMVTGLSFRDQ